MHLGSYAIDDLLTFTCNTHTPSTGAAVDADAVPGYRVYEDETGTPLLTGSMALLDDANTVGFYSEQITLSAANGFEEGKCYTVRITGVVGGVTGVTERTFQIGAKVDASASAVASVMGAVGSVTADVTLTGDYDAAKTAASASSVSAITTVLAGITSLAAWLRGLARKSTMDATAKTELNTGGGTYNEATDSLEGSVDIGGSELTAEQVWAHTTRTLTQSAAEIEAAVRGSLLTIVRGDSWSASITGLGSVAARAKLWFTVKSSLSDLDAASRIQIEETAGLVYLNGAAGTALDGAITVDDEDAGDITITLAAAASAQLAPGSYSYDLQWFDGDDAIHTLTVGAMRVVGDVTRAVA